MLISKFSHRTKGSNEDVITEGHFSFLSDSGYTGQSANDCVKHYDVISFLDTAPEIIL